MGRMGPSGLAVAFLLVGGCRRSEAPNWVDSRVHAQVPTESGLVTAPTDAGVHRQARRDCSAPIPVYEDGHETGTLCEDEVGANGFTVIDLGNDWAPWVFEGHEGQPPAQYRATYVRLADERGSEEGTSIDPEQQSLELYGIFPTFRVLRQRADASAVHACHRAIDDDALRRFAGVLHRRDADHVAASPNLARNVEAMRRQLEREATRRGLASVDELADDARMGAMYARYREADGWMQILRTLQRHLRCDGLLGTARDGVFDGATSRALTSWQRRNMLVSRGYLDEHSRDFMLLSSEERVFQDILRVLRERVVDATGLVEDGTASGDFGTVLGRDLDAPELHASAVQGRMPNAAPDLISPATEAAARALGLTSPESAFAVLDSFRDLRHLRVAVRLPPLPPYYGSHMDLRAEIDRGDIRPSGNLPTDRRPTTVVYVRHEGRDIPLFRWNTTIGGYQDELMPDGTVQRKYKESPAGARIWRDVIAGPSWMPPSTTPDDELIARGRPNTSIVGPGYRSAYGLLMVMHLQVLPPGRDGQPRFHDEGVRSHGSVSYHSILGGFSHGCHRLFNHLALRLGGFLVRHRNHVVRGQQPVEYERDLLIEGSMEELRVETRGYLYELTPPVDVNVLPGTDRRRR